MDRFPIQADRFRHAQTGLDCKHQQGVVALAEPRRLIGRGEDCFDLGAHQEMHLALVVSLAGYREHALYKGAVSRLLEGHKPQERSRWVDRTHTFFL